ncbi:MAG TPA: copper resistance protein CopC [Rickettsiales bacterium]|nr:copper resistance protein CopC [Rickettsiales bacterium]
MFAALLGAASQAQALQLVIQNTTNVQMWQFGSSVPGSNESLTTPPQAVTINFSVAVKPDGSFIKVYDPYGKEIQTSNTLFSGSSMYVNMPPYKDGYGGTYRVEWQAYCQCNDPKMLNGSFYFNLR